MSWTLHLPSGARSASMFRRSTEECCAARAPERLSSNPEVARNALRLATNNGRQSPVRICFTDISAWSRIADLAEAGHPIEELQLEQPKGEIGYVMSVTLDEKQPELYIKVQLKRGKIFGRSFHYSTK